MREGEGIESAGEEGNLLVLAKNELAGFDALHGDTTACVIFVKNFADVGIKVFQIQLKLMHRCDAPEIHAVVLFPELILQTFLIGAENTIFGHYNN